MPLLSTFGAASARGFGNLSGIALPSDSLFNTVSFLSHFDGSNNGVNNAFDDSSSSNHTITANGDVTQGSFGPFARPDGQWAVAFDGSADFIEGPSVDLLGSGAFTVECWVNVPSKTTASNFTDAFLAQYQSNGNLIIGSKFNVVRVWMGSSEVRVGTVGIVGNGWHHIALTRNSSGSVRLFVDGSADGAAFTNSTDFSQNLENFEIGSWDNGANSALNGNISNLRVVKGTAVYDPSASTITVPTSSLTAIANTSLLTCQSNRFIDNSTNSHTLTPSGQTAVSAFGPFLTSEVYDAGVNGASAYFDGDADYLTIASSSDFDFGTSDFCWECWVFQTSRSAFQLIMAQDDYSDGNSISCWLTGTGQASIYYEGGGTHYTTTATVPLNTWTHLAWVRKGTSTNEFSIYINGTAEVSGTMATSFNQDGIIIGQQANGNYDFNGYVCDIRIANGSHIYASNFTPPTAPLTAVTNTKLLLNMADGQAIDSAAQNNLTLYGDAKISNAQSKFGDTSVYVDGTDLVRTGINSSFAFGTGDFTIEAFVYLTAINQYDNLFDMRYSGNTNHIDIYFDGSPLRLRYFVNGGERFTSDTAVSLNTWTHLALVRSNGTTKLYQQGNSVGSYSDATNLLAGQLHLGGRYSNENFAEGYFDEVRVSNTARYTSNFIPPTEPFADKGR